jgi:hypothetical protein
MHENNYVSKICWHHDSPQRHIALWPMPEWCQRLEPGGNEMAANISHIKLFYGT